MPLSENFIVAAATQQRAAGTPADGASPIGGGEPDAPAQPQELGGGGRSPTGILDLIAEQQSAALRARPDIDLDPFADRVEVRRRLHLHNAAAQVHLALDRNAAAGTNHEQLPRVGL